MGLCGGEEEVEGEREGKMVTLSPSCSTAIEEERVQRNCEAFSCMFLDMGEHWGG